MTVKEDKEVYMGVFKGRKGGGEIMYSYYNLKNKH